MRRIIVIGSPISHSLSPSMHNAALSAVGLDGEFVCRTQEVTAPGLEGFLVGARGGGIAGLCVTMPHKTKIVGMLDSLSEDAELANAVNTVVCADGRLEGYNTDGSGCVDALEDAGVVVKGCRVVILGAGGAGRAAAVALALSGACAIRVANRTEARAQECASIVSKATGVDVTPSGLETLRDSLADADILVNATPSGMTGVAGIVVSEGDLHPNIAVLDMVYHPRETELVKAARRTGATAVPGIEMLLRQGFRQFELLTGRAPPLEAMRKAVAGGPEARP